MKKLLLLLLSVLIFSCATKKEILYFQDLENLNGKETNNTFEPIIENNDILHVALSSQSEAALSPFLKDTGVASVNVANSNPGLRGYLVDSEGTIQFQVLGDVKVAGKTRTEIEKDLKAKLSAYVKDVVVDVRILNFKITVLGEVNSPGVFAIDDERVTLPQAIGLAGDLNKDGKRENITVIREENGVQKVTRIDLTKTDLFSSPFYYLKQNDVVYVEPSLKGVKKAGFIPDVPALLSLFTIVLSTVIILTR